MITAIILAAGRSRRMGVQKLLLPFGGGTVIGHIAGEVLRSRVDRTIVVVGQDGARIAEALGGCRLTLVANADPDADMLSSVRCGLRALPPDCEAVLVVLGDQPTLTADLVGRMIDAFRTAGRGIVVPVYGGKPGHPILFSARYRDEVLTRYDSVGLCGLPQAHPEDVFDLSVTSPAVLADMDCPEDYRRELARRGGRRTGPPSPRLWRTSPISLRVSVTDRCRFRCVYCTPAEGVKRFAPAEILSYEEIVRFVRLMKRHGRLAKVHITGGEPLDRRDIVKLVAMLAAEGIDDLAMTTNGQRLSELASELKRAGLRRVNVSLNTLDPRVFRELTGGGELGPTLAGIDAALAAGLAPVKGNMTVLRGINDHEVGDLVQWGIARGVEVRFIELMPIGPAAPRHRDWFVSAEELLERLRASFALTPLPRPPGSSCHEYRVAAARPGRSAESAGLIGIIAPCTQPFCADCARLRLTAGGELVGCLARNSRTSVLRLLRAGGPTSERAILAKVRAVMGRKRTDDAFSGNHCMVKTGG